MKTNVKIAESIIERYKKAQLAYLEASKKMRREEDKTRDAEQEKNTAQEQMWIAQLRALHKIIPHWSVCGAPRFELYCVFGFLPRSGRTPTAAVLSYCLRNEEVTICTRESFISPCEVVPFERAVEDLKKIGVTFD